MPRPWWAAACSALDGKKIHMFSVAAAGHQGHGRSLHGGHGGGGVEAAWRRASTGTQESCCHCGGSCPEKQSWPQKASSPGRVPAVEESSGAEVGGRAWSV